MEDSIEVNEQHFSKSKLVVQQSEDEEPSGRFLVVIAFKGTAYNIVLGKKEHQELVPENSKNNSESFDVLTGTMSPDSELFSVGLSSSSSGESCHTSLIPPFRFILTL